MFVEMASPGTSFEGAWQERSVGDRAKIFSAANRYAAAQLARHKEYAAWSGLGALAATPIPTRSEAGKRSPGRKALVLCRLDGRRPGGAKSAYLATTDESYRQIMKRDSFYHARSATGMPFPKTRKGDFRGREAG